MRSFTLMIGSFFKTEFEECRKLLKTVPSVLFAVLVLAVVSMNLLANKELFRTEWVALDCGFILSWIPFLIMDAVCRAHGGKAAARLSIIAIVINLALFAIFKLISLTPGMWGAYYASGSLQVNQALNDTIGGSTWIVFGSALAMAVASIVNSALNMLIARFIKRDGFGQFALRSFPSTVISQFVDNLVFALIVSVPLFGWNLRQALPCSTVAALFELSLEVVFSLFGYRISLRMKGRER